MKWTMMLVLLIACLGVGKAVKQCYQCTPTSLTDKKCNDPYDTGSHTAELKDCPTGMTDACMKAEALGITTRSCASRALCEDSKLGGVDSCLVVDDTNAACCCTGEGCNSATTRQVSYFALAAMMFVANVVFY